MIIRFDYRKNKHQEEFHADTTSPLLHLSSGFGGGKSYALIMKALQLSWLNRPFAGGIVAPSFTDYKKDLLPMIEEILEKNRIKYQHHKTEHWFRFPWTKGKLYVATAEKKLRGPNWSYAAINEVTLIPLERYREVVGRVRVKGAKAPQVASCGTPEGIASEYYSIFIEKPLDGLRVVYGSTLDNLENLDPTYVERLSASFDSKMLDAYLKGLWVNMAGNRFYYAYDPARNDDSTNAYDSDQLVHCSIDFNVDPMTATLWHFDGHTARAFDQVELSGGEGFDTARLADALIARGFTGRNTIVYPDPAGNARTTKGMPDVEILKRKGFNEVRVKLAAPRLRERQLNVNNLLEKRCVTIHPVKCQGLKRDWISVEQDPVTLEKKKNNPKLTHFSDGADYMLDILFPFSGRRSETRAIKIR